MQRQMWRDSRRLQKHNMHSAGRDREARSAGSLNSNISALDRAWRMKYLKMVMLAQVRPSFSVRHFPSVHLCFKPTQVGNTNHRVNNGNP